MACKKNPEDLRFKQVHLLQFAIHMLASVYGFSYDFTDLRIGVFFLRYYPNPNELKMREYVANLLIFQLKCENMDNHFVRYVY